MRRPTPTATMIRSGRPKPTAKKLRDRRAPPAHRRAPEAAGEETAGREPAAEPAPASGDPPAGEAPGDPWFPVPHEATASAAPRTSPRGARGERVIGRGSRRPPWTPRARPRAARAAGPRRR